LKNKGVHGILVCATYGFGPLMSIHERKKVAEISVAGAKGLSVIVHVGSSNPQDTFELAKHAEDVGADAISSVTPFYYEYTDESIFSFFRHLISRVNIPVYVYNNPERSGNRVTYQLLGDLAEEGLAGIVESSHSLIEYWEYLTSVGENKNFEFIIGTDALMFPAMLSGTKACVSGFANVFPEMIMELYNSIRDKNYEKAAKLQLRVIQVRKALRFTPVIPLCYEILRLRGVEVGEPKYPFEISSIDHIMKAKQELEKLKLLVP
jgi:N-acetylneuraminate lyase/4-hydroxy-tetrahydrodipicolinate synthase